MAIISRGQSGQDVTTLQQQLNTFGYGLEIDGQFGPATQQAVMDFQTKHGLTPDGVVGENTESALMAVGGQLKIIPTNVSVTNRNVMVIDNGFMSVLKSKWGLLGIGIIAAGLVYYSKE